MRAFSQLLDDLVYTRSRNTKLKLIGDYLKETPDPDRGYGLAALTGTLDIPAVKGAAVPAIPEEKVDPALLTMKRDYVRDIAETMAPLCPNRAGEAPALAESTIMRPSGSGTGSASSSSMAAPRRGSTAAPATTFRGAFPTLQRRSGRPGSSTASCWCVGKTRASPTCTAGRRRASTHSSSASAARMSAPRCSAPT